MRNVIIGCIVFVGWALFSIWLFFENTNSEMTVPDSGQSISEPQMVEPEIPIEEPIPGNMMVYFEFDNTNFKTDAKTNNGVTDFKSYFDKNPKSIILITGHADEIGSSEYNQVLGYKRALVVQEYFGKKGFNENNLIAGSKGENKSVADQTTEEGRAKNRRVEITIIK
jgi:outer membrane protein OmpA-like peptidoglycan-associated protein